MCKIYSPPEEFEIKNFNPKTWKKEEENYLNNLRKFCKSKNTGKYIGKILKIPFANGFAKYMVYNENPMELIHLPIGDGWYSPIVNKLSSKDIKEMIDTENALEKIFS